MKVNEIGGDYFLWSLWRKENSSAPLVTIVHYEVSFAAF